MLKQYWDLVLLISDTYDLHCDIEVQKDFALAVKHYPFSGVLFALRSGKAATITSALTTMSVDKLLSLLDVKGAT